jgi:hypothetical protein
MTSESSTGNGPANWLVRGGVATPQQLQNGTREHIQAPGIIGFSVQYQPGQTIEQLARAAQFPHALISVTTLERLMAAGASVGYNISIVKSPGRGFHHTVIVPAPLPEVLAQALSEAFEQGPNPFRVQQ